MVRVVAVLAFTVHAPPLSARRIPTVVLFVPLVVAVAEQFTNPDPRAIVGVDGTWKASLNTAVIESPAAIAPVAVVVKPTVHVSIAFGASRGAENVTAVTAVAALMVTLAAGFPAASWF